MPDTKKLAGADAVARRDAIVEAFRPLVLPIAKHVARQYGAITTIDDMTQAGCIGLLDAAARFERYARQKIAGAMRDSIRQRDWRESGHARHQDVAPMPDPVGNLLDRVVLLSELYEAIEAELTPRETEIVDLQLEGHTGTEIAEHLGIRQQTVVVHQQRAKQKLRQKLAA